MVEEQAENVIRKIRHYLITTMGKATENATAEEFYRAFSKALREEIMINWTATSNTFCNKKVRKAYYLSMEYMPGRCLRNNINNIGASELIECVLKKMGRKLGDILILEPDIGIGNGGLGRLASCFMDSLATLQYPALGYGLRYQYGIFEQELWYGVQIERPDCWLLNENPWEFRRDNHAVSVDFGGKLEKDLLLDAESVRALPFDIPIIGYAKEADFSVLTMRLWSTKESPRNFKLQKYNAGRLDQAGENTSLTDVLYPSDNHDTGKRIRLKQEFLLVSASLQDIIYQHIRTFGSIEGFADYVRIQLNDTHPALAIPELMRILIDQYNFGWSDAKETVKTVCSYTNHTVLKEALEEWNERRIQLLLPRQLAIIRKLNDELLSEIKAAHPDDNEKQKRMAIIDQGQVRMANLSIYATHKTNGVAKLHSDILRDKIFNDFTLMYPDRITNVTNGVTQRRWLLSCNPLLTQFIHERIGDSWITNFKEIEKLAPLCRGKKDARSISYHQTEKQRKLSRLLK